MFRTPYDGVRYRVGLDCGSESMTKQSFQEECDINNILKRFHATGLITHVNKYQGQYADVSQGMDYRAALDCVARGRDAFASLPAKMRSRFHNDPGEFLEFVSDPANEAEMRELGILKDKPVVAPVAPAPTAPVDKQPPVVNTAPA